MKLDNMTFFVLLSEFETTHVPLEVIAEKFLGLCRKRAYEKANACALPFPVMRGESQKAKWVVDLRDLADWLDQMRQQAKEEWQKVNR